MYFLDEPVLGGMLGSWLALWWQWGSFQEVMKQPLQPGRTLGANSSQLYERAEKVIPGGIYGHVSPVASLPLHSPYYASRGLGCRYWDADDREFVDFMCAYGPNVLGYLNPEVEEAAEVQRRKGDCFNHPTARSVELVERLVQWVDFADWGVLAKNGGDMTSWAIRVAREHTSRPKILKIRGAYHGVDPWCAQQPGGVIAEDVAHIHSFAWNDLNEFHDLLKTHDGQVAGVIVTPYHHPTFADSVDADPEFVRGLNEACRARGLVLIVDDIRAGFRLNLHGSHALYGWEPDLACYCKALGNGYPISATLGREHLRVAASKVFLTGSYWNGAVAQAAALKTLEILEREAVPQHLERVGLRLREGLLALGEEFGRPLVASGPLAAPFFRFAHERNFREFQQFCALVMAGQDQREAGAFFHPHHNWFLCAAHQDADIDWTLGLARHALEQMAAGT